MTLILPNGRVPDHLPLLSHHYQTLHGESGISDPIIEGRGYYSADRGEEHKLLSLGFSRGQFTLPAIVIPIWGVDGRVHSHTIRMDDPWSDGDTSRGKYQFVKNARMLLDVPPSMVDLLGDPSVPLWLTEGAKKVDALASHGILVVGLSGVWNWRGRNAYGGSVILPDWESIAFRNVNTGVPRLFPIVFDYDVLTKTGPRDARNRVTMLIDFRDGKAGWITLPPGPLGKVDDFLRERSVEELKELIQDPNWLPEIAARREDLTEVARESWDHVLESGDEPRIFTTGGLITRLGYVENEAARIEVVSPVAMQCTLSDVIRFHHTDGQGNKRYVVPPKMVAEAMLDLQDARIPRLTGVSAVPFFSGKGELMRAAGYDPTSGTLYDPLRRQPDVSEAPTESEVAEATGLIREMIADFPFDGESSRANAISVMVERVARPLIDGPMPLHILSAPMAGTGKGFLANALLRPVLGRWPTMRPGPGSDEEWRKLITTALIEGEQAFVVDNINKPIDSGALAGATTSRKFQDRILGSSKSVHGEITWSWMALANNPVVSLEIGRRAVWSRMVALSEKPWQRQGEFAIEDLMGWVEEHADRLLWAALTMVQHWIVVGRPPGVRVLASYESWSRVVGGVLATCGIEGFLENQDLINAEAVNEDEGWSDFVEKWWELYGSVETPSAMLFAAADGAVELWGKDEEGRRKSLGRQIARRMDRVYGDKIIRKGHGRRTWRLESLVGEESRGGEDGLKGRIR